MRLHQTCPTCERRYSAQIQRLKDDPTLTGPFLEVALGAIPKPKPVTIIKESKVGARILVKFSCGHSTFTSLTVLESATKKLESNTGGFVAYDYQVDGLDFIEKSNYNCLIADEMGLGKTVQAILAWINNPDNLTPCVFIVKAATIYQWIRMFKVWGTLDDMGICPIVSSANPIYPGIFKCYILSMDLLPDVVDKLISLRPRLVVADEVQGFKNPKSARTKALVKLCQESQVPHKIFLSGTPIKNRASEYFPILNLLAPGHFPSMRHFATRWLEPVGKGSLNRIRPYALEDFKKLTARWILRREVCDVQKDLPPLRTETIDITITDPVVKKMYNTTLDLFSNYLKDSSQRKDPIAMLGWLAKLRHITAGAKLNECVELVKEFLDSTEDQKIAIGIHHKSVRDGLFYGLEPYGAVKLSGEDSAQAKDFIVQKFQKPETRVLIVNEVSGGTGLDGLQCCNNVFVLERQWNSADEDQFIKRFLRDGQKRPVRQAFLMAHGTIDQFFADLVDTKRAILGETLSGYDFTNDEDGLRSLAETVVNNRL